MSDNGDGKETELELDPGAEARLARLPREIEPPGHLWPRIATRIAASARPEVPRVRSRWPVWAAGLAASALLVASSSLITAWLLRPPGVTQLAAAPPTNAAAANTDPTTYLPPEYLLARYELSTALEQNLEQMAPSTRRTVERNLREIRRGLEEISAALVRDPSNPTLQRLLLAATEQELEYLNELRRLTEDKS